MTSQSWAIALSVGGVPLDCRERWILNFRQVFPPFYFLPGSVVVDFKVPAGITVAAKPGWKRAGDQALEAARRVSRELGL